MRKVPVILAVLLSLFMIGIVVLADQGHLPKFITGLYDFQYGDKVGHFLLMGGLSFLVSWALPARSGHRHVLAILAVAAIVALEEVSQAWFGTRHMDITDLAASLAGIFCLGWVGWRLRDLNKTGKKIE